MNLWHDIDPARITSEDFVGVIEVQKGSKSKYELDKETGFLILDRVLFTSTVYPANYGFIPLTYAQDDDPLDVLVICSEPIIPLAEVQCYPIGVINMVDEKQQDEKIIAIPYGDPTYNVYRDINALPAHVLEEMTHFFEVYKTLEHKETTVQEVGGREKAIAVIDSSIDRYLEYFEDGIMIDPKTGKPAEKKNDKTTAASSKVMSKIQKKREKRKLKEQKK